MLIYKCKEFMKLRKNGWMSALSWPLPSCSLSFSLALLRFSFLLWLFFIIVGFSAIQLRQQQNARPYQARQDRGARPRPHRVPPSIHWDEEGWPEQALRSQKVGLDPSSQDWRLQGGHPRVRRSWRGPWQQVCGGCGPWEVHTQAGRSWAHQPAQVWEMRGKKLL